MAIILVIATLLSFNNYFSQDRGYNLPPGESISSDFVAIDYSFKLEQITTSNEVMNFQNENFLSFYSQEQLEQLKLEDLEKFKYYERAKYFYDQLSNRVKLVYSTDELWYIYKYDVRLKDMLELVIE